MSEAQNGDKAQRKARRSTVNAELRRAYDEVVKEPVPDGFKSLLGDQSGGTDKAK